MGHRGVGAWFVTASMSLAVTGLALTGLVATAPSTASALTASPVVRSTAVSPSRLSNLGGRVRLIASVADATTCKVSASPALHGFPATVSCSSGRLATTIEIPKNTSKKVAHEHLTVTAERGTSTADRSTAVAVDPAFGWSKTLEPPTAGYLSDVSCISSTFCMGVDDAGNAVTWDGTSWSSGVPTGATKNEGAWTAVSCSSTTFCMAGYFNVATFDGSGWTKGDALFGGEGILSIGCGSSTLCAASADDSDNSFPLEGWNGASWTSGTALPASASDHAAVTCSQSFCLAYDGDGWVSEFDGTTWSTPTQPLSTLDGISCTPSSGCMAVSDSESVTFDGSSWATPTGDGVPIVFGNLSCQTLTRCEALGVNLAYQASYMLVTFDGTSWSDGPSVGYEPELPMSCTSLTFCMIPQEPDSAAMNPSAAPDLGTQSAALPSGWGLSSLQCFGTTFCAGLAGSAVFVDQSGVWTSTTLANTAQTYSLSCAGPSYCLAVGGAVYQFDGTSWTSVSMPSGVTGLITVSCGGTVPGCVATAPNGVVDVYSSGAWTASASLSGNVSQLSCTSTTFCMAIDGGQIRKYDGDSWSVVSGTPYTTGILDMQCTSPTFCMIVAPDQPDADYSYWNGQVWTAEQWIPTFYGYEHNLSCASSKMCVLNDVVWNGSTWTEPGSWDSNGPIGCGTATSCISMDGNLATAFDPAGQAPLVAAVDPGELTDVSCAAPDSCAAVDSAGHAFVADGSGSWTPDGVVDRAAGLTSVSCAPSAPLWCTAVDSRGQAVVYSGGKWHVPEKTPGGDLTGVSCPTTSFCAAVASDGLIVRYDGSGWTAMARPFAVVTGDRPQISCASTTFCVAVGGRPSNLGLGYATYDGTSWTSGSSDLVGFSVSCVSSTFCFSGSSATFNGTSWSADAAPPAPSGDVERITAVSCESVDMCVAVDEARRALVFNGSSWGTPQVISDKAALTAVSCPTATYCATLDGSNRVYAASA